MAQKQIHLTLDIEISQNNFRRCNLDTLYLSAFLGMTIGYYTNAMAFGFYNPTRANLWVYLLCQLGISIQQAIFLLTPPFLIQILLEHLNMRTNYEKCTTFEDCKKTLDIFATLSKSFNPFLLVYFTFNQVFAIFNVCSTASMVSGTNSLGAPGALMGFCGLWVMFFAVIFSLNVLTGEIEDSFEKLKGLKLPIQEKLLQCQGEVEKAQMNYLLQRIEDVKPMNACGYFEIGRSTLTSMLSVRSDQNL